MNKNELKRILRPLIKDCIKEVIFEEGTLSTIISEVVKGTTGSQIVYESRQPTSKREINSESVQRKRDQLLEQKRKMLDAIGRDAYNGVDLFEGTSPISRQNNTSSPHGSRPLDGIAANDPGVDLSTFGATTNIWKKLAGK